jgi:hypothetical protein
MVDKSICGDQINERWKSLAGESVTDPNAMVLAKQKNISVLNFFISSPKMLAFRPHLSPLINHSTCLASPRRDQR